ncbi:HGR020Cp [Eremothecium sinecaudum]|uniref:U1 small nuclear ribonucleoprotein component SNU71 n=1 Tax=Eremothecium sinecaudum TaxID=45286 RepID=A0A0X8HVT9_9SACH|nr:HGR020Cp [Eremothecium sinecaudum]AMD22359.1 HGR020Cp [Eremothecium sinecaudum]
MADIVFVSTSLYLGNKPNWKSTTSRPGYTPILKKDLYKFEQSLLTVTHGSAHHTVKHNISENTSNSNDVNETQKSIKDEKFQDLRLFLPISLSQQLHTVAIHNLPDNPLKTSSFISWLERFTISKFPNPFGQEVRSTGHDVIESWSHVRASTLENTQNLFLRLVQAPKYPQIVMYWIELFAAGSDSNISIHVDQNTEQYARDSAVNYKSEVTKEDIEALDTAVNSLRMQPSENTSDLGAMIAYDVDMSTLSDLPRDSEKQLVKDIVEFRTRVLTMEKEKRNKESLEEGKRSRAQLKRVLEQIRKIKGSEAAGNIEDDEEYDDDEDEEDEIQQDDLELEKRKQDKVKEIALQEFESVLAHLNTVLIPQLRKKEQELRMLEEYEAKLLRERPLYLKELLHLANSEYYDHDRAFKEKEEQLDEENRKANYSSNLPSSSAEKQHIATYLRSEEHSTTKLDAEVPSDRNKEPTARERKIKLALKKVFDSRAQEADSDTENENSVSPPALRAHLDTSEASSTNVDLLPYEGKELDAKLSYLRQSRLVDELVKEYLGVYEAELVDYIVDNIKEHHSRSSLLQELQETFDEDSNRIVDIIWKALLN